VWDPESGHLLQSLEGLRHRIMSLAGFPSPDGQGWRVVAGDYGGGLMVWDPETGQRLLALEGRVKCVQALVCFEASSPGYASSRIVAACYDGAARVYDGESGEMVLCLQYHRYPVVAVAAYKEPVSECDRIVTGYVPLTICWIQRRELVP
jgi:WD40 repeat protein